MKRGRPRSAARKEHDADVAALALLDYPEVDELAGAIEIVTADLRRQELRRDPNLLDWAVNATPFHYWDRQREILDQLSALRATVAVPACFSSGKTFVAATAVLAFFDLFPPRENCPICGGRCEGSKIITTSSTWDHLKDELWGEIRNLVPKLAWSLDAKVVQMRIEGSPVHYVIARSPDSTEAMQGYHAPHVLIVADEGTSVDHVLAEGIDSLRASGDARLLTIFNPTTDDTWAAGVCKRPNTKVIRVPAHETPNFTDEPIPPGAQLINQSYLDDLTSSGRGPGTMTWTTKVEARFWSQAEDLLIFPAWYDRSRNVEPLPGPLVMGIDLASYGSNENVIAYRAGNTLLRIEPHPSMRQDLFWQIVATRVQAHNPAFVVYDADGVGAGVYESARNACGEHRLIPVRSGIDVGGEFINLRSMWWWRLRGLFESGRIRIAVEDAELRAQTTSIKYGFTDKSKIKVESKENLRRRGLPSPDRADSLVYSFAFDAPAAPPPRSDPRSDEAMWNRDLDDLDSPITLNPVLGVSDY